MGVIPEKLRHFPHPLFLQELRVDELRTAVVVDYNGGGVNDNLEERFASYCGKKWGVSFNSGTSALISMFTAVGIGRGDEVIVPTYTFFATATPLNILGATPVLADCDENGNLLASEIERLLSERTKAVVVTHMWGIPAQMTAICKACDQFKLILLEDASHAHGASQEGKKLGSFGKAGAWSLGAFKLISGGQGGIMLTDDREVYERAILHGHYNRRGRRDITLEHLKPYATTGTGQNLRMHPYSAALVLAQLDGFEDQLVQRRKTALDFLTGIKDIPLLKSPQLSETCIPSWYAIPLRFTGNLERKHQLIAALHSEGAIDVDAPNSTCPISSFKLFKEIARQDEHSWRNAEVYHNQLLKLPSWYGPNASEYCEAYLAAFKKVFSEPRAWH